MTRRQSKSIEPGHGVLTQRLLSKPTTMLLMTGRLSRAQIDAKLTALLVVRQRQKEAVHRQMVAEEAVQEPCS